MSSQQNREWKVVTIFSSEGHQIRQEAYDAKPVLITGLPPLSMLAEGTSQEVLPSLPASSHYFMTSTPGKVIKPDAYIHGHLQTNLGYMYIHLAEDAHCDLAFSPPVYFHIGREQEKMF